MTKSEKKKKADWVNCLAERELRFGLVDPFPFLAKGASQTALAVTICIEAA